MNVLKISAQYIDHMGSDLTVVNAARASFDTESYWQSECWSCGHRAAQNVWSDDACPKCKADCTGHLTEPKLSAADANLIRYLALGYRTKEWDDLIDEIIVASIAGNRLAISDMLRIHKNRPQHWAPFGHPHIQIRMCVPIFLARQLVKHQVGGVWSEESRRYISDEPDVWFTDEWHSRPEDIKQGAAGLVEHQDMAQGLAETVTENCVGTYMAMVNPNGNLKVAPEEARTILPLNTMTTVVWTGSLAFWARVVNTRVEGHAQRAARELGTLVSGIVEPLFPESWGWLISPNILARPAPAQTE